MSERGKVPQRKREDLKEEEEREDLSHLTEMAVLRKKRTGLPVNIFLDDTGLWMKSGHYNRIKFQPDTGDRTLSTDMIPMSISDDPQVLVKTENLKLNGKQIKEIKRFVRANKDLILRLGRQEIDIVEFSERMVLNS